MESCTRRETARRTLLLDLLTQAEDLSFERRFDIDLLAERVTYAVRWARDHPVAGKLPVGLFGASTGAAAALRVAAADHQIASVVSRGGRPDLAGTLHLPRVRAPTLLVVGGLDADVIALNRQAFEELSCERVAALVHSWFKGHFEQLRRSGP